MADKETPMMKQYRQLRRQLPDDTILFFRLGDFYEMFFDDAKTASEILDISLTKRNKIPMCGIPFHAADAYLPKLIRAGVKVALCEQVEDAGASKGIVKRDIVRVITPGTVLEETVLDARQNNFLAGISQRGDGYGMAVLDLSTGTFWVEEMTDIRDVQDNLVRYAPSECIIPEEEEGNDLLREMVAISGTLLTPYEDWTFETDAAADFLMRHFKLHSLEGFGITNDTNCVGAAGAVLHYVSKHLRRDVNHIHAIRVKRSNDYMALDETTIANLELVEPRNTADKGRAPTLLKVLDTSSTAMGGRMLRDWILRPLTDLSQIKLRQDAISTLCDDRSLFRDLREALGAVKDLERLIARLNTGSGNARDLRSVANSMTALPRLQELLGKTGGRLQELAESVDPLPETVAKIETAIEDEPPMSIREGGMFRQGFHAELDELREAASAGRQWLADFQAAEQERTGIKSLKIRHNKVFGYYIEITKSNLDQVPEDYVRKQTMTNAERFITPQLKEYENKILGAQDRAVDLEHELLLELRSHVVGKTHAIQLTAEAVAEIDVLGTLADRALTLRYTKPALHDGDELSIKDGRHPVIEQIDEGERFVPNDVKLDCSTDQLILITGPNMAGKSTYIRQVALLAIMAQIGSFIPAKEASIGMVDRVFTRVGASDDLARGRSTFMVEMQETANILNNATPKSLIVLDEIGRGTSTFDGISIAWAVAEYLHNIPEVKAKTLFATHYHELTDLAKSLDGVKNYSVLVKETNDRIVFLRKIVPGAADKSYGIQVAKLAGLPNTVIDRSKDILRNLEESELNEAGQPKLAKKRKKPVKLDHQQLSFFDEITNSET